MNKKTLELLLVNYKAMYNQMKLPCAEKTRFEKLIASVEEELTTKSDIIPDPDIIYSKEWCSCGHRILDCDCKAGCKCECNKRFLGAY
tara:strand:+ start:1134 stop:1397 length:264 start_codon:yes stop_codon:yes gene_type:complete